MPVLNIHNEESYDLFAMEGEQYVCDRQTERHVRRCDCWSSFSHVCKVSQNMTAVQGGGESVCVFAVEAKALKDRKWASLSECLCVYIQS